MWSSTKAHSTKFKSRHHGISIITFLTTPDLIVTKILTFLMPTNATTSLLLLVSLLGGLVGVYVKVLPSVLKMESSTTLDLSAAKPVLEKLVRLHPLLDAVDTSAPLALTLSPLTLLNAAYGLVAILLLRSFFPSVSPRPYYEDPRVTSRRRLPMRSSCLRFCSSPSAARSNACSVALADSPNVQRLDGKWKFRYTTDPGAAISRVRAGRADKGKWEEIPVPSNWQLGTVHDKVRGCLSLLRPSRARGWGLGAMTHVCVCVCFSFCFRVFSPF